LHVNINVTVSVNGSCEWTYQLDADNSRLPPVFVVARCLDTSRCEPVHSSVTVERRNSTTGQTRQVRQQLAVACTLRRQSGDQLDTSEPYEYDDVL